MGFFLWFLFACFVVVWLSLVVDFFLLLLVFVFFFLEGGCFGFCSPSCFVPSQRKHIYMKMGIFSTAD